MRGPPSLPRSRPVGPRCLSADDESDTLPSLFPEILHGAILVLAGVQTFGIALISLHCQVLDSCGLIGVLELQRKNVLVTQN